VCDLLDDSRTYEVLKRDPTVSFERKMNALLLEYKKRGLIPQRLYDRLRSSGGLTPLFYGLPKIHKPGVPLRHFILNTVTQFAKSHVWGDRVWFVIPS